MIRSVTIIKLFRVLGLLVGMFICQQGVVAAAFAEDQARLITLSDGIRRVLEDSRLVKIALLDEEMAFQDSLIARSALLPQLNISASQTFFKYQPAAKLDSVVAPTSERHFASYGFDVYQTIFDFG